MSGARAARLHHEYPPLSAGPGEDNDESEQRESRLDADVDIIAVQGLASTYERTWSVEVNAETNERYHWLRERLPLDLKNNDIHANIYAFEYPSVWYDRDPDHTSLEECGRQLLASIHKNRSHKGAIQICPQKRDRPIIFVGHSFGGLVIKQALLLASQAQPSPVIPGNISEHAADMRGILSAVAGIIFLGTPHRGSAISNLAQIKMKIGGFLTGTPTSPELITVLELDSILLRYIQSSFSRLRKAPELAGMRVYCFFEKKALAVPPQRVVEEHSACLDDAENIGLDANHMELNKYGSGPNENYDVLYQAIVELCKTANQIIPPRLESRVYNSSRSSADLQELRHWLAPSMQQTLQLNRKLAVHKAHSFTCHWLLGEEFFDVWKSSEAETSILWFTGIPGSGKSVLAAFTVDKLRSWANGAPNPSRPQNDANDSLKACAVCTQQKSRPGILYFFGGVDRTHESTEHVLGTLIDQLLTIYRDNEAVILFAQKFHRKSAGDISIIVLLELLGRLIVLCGPVYIIIDGVDELPSPGETLAALSRLCNHTPKEKVHLMFCSQTTRMLREADSELLESANCCSITDYTSADIQQFIRRRTRELVATKPDLLSQESQIISSLEQKANGMFQWVKTTTDQLALDATSESLDDYLNDLTSEMADGWELVFGRLGCSTLRNKQAAKKALMWLYAAARPLSATELHAAMYPPANYAELRELASCLPETILERDAAHARELRALLVPLIEISKAGNSLHYVQLAHSSLRAALTAPGRLGTDTVRSWIGFSAKEAHLESAITCMAMCGNSTFAMANAFGSQPIFMVDYAWQHWAYHLKLSDEQLISGKVADVFERMIAQVSQDSAVFLCALADFVDQPLKPATWRDEELAQLVCFQRAQKSLTQVVEAMLALRNALPIAQNLQSTRATLERLEGLGIPQIEKKFGTRLFEFVSYARDMVTEEKSSVHSLKGDDYARSCGAGRLALNPTSRCLWDLTKKLRSLTLRFAVNPIHTVLVLNSRSEQFSPINALVNIAALFEEVGNYPYWAHLPSQTDVLEPFVTTVQDAQHGPARFVLYTMVNRNFFHEEAGSNLCNQEPPIRFHAPRPDRRLAADDFSISASHKALVKKVHAIPYSTYHVSMVRLGMLQSNDHFYQTFVLNPLGNRFIRNNLMLPVSNDMEDPRFTLAQHAPAMAREAHRTEIINAIPQLLLSHVIHYVMMLFERFGGVTRQVFTVQFSRLQTAKAGLERFKATFMSCFNVDSYVDLQHCFMAVLLYGLRCLLFPSLGVSARAVRWKELTYSFSHPAQYLEVIQQSKYGFFSLRLWLCFLQAALHYALGENAIPAGVELSMGPQQNKALAFVFVSFGIYHTIVLLEDALYHFLFAVATSTATGLLIFRDPDSIQNLVLSSFSFWFYSGIGFFIGISSALVGGPSPWYQLLSMAPQVLGLILIARYGGRFKLGERVWWLVEPVTTQLSRGLYFMMEHYGRIVQLTSTTIFIYLLWRTFWMVDGWITDPYNTKGSRSTLNVVQSRLRATLDSRQVKSIGSSPFGGELQRRQESIDMQIRETQADNQRKTTATAAKEQAPLLYAEPLEAKIDHGDGPDSLYRQPHKGVTRIRGLDSSKSGPAQVNSSPAKPITADQSRALPRSTLGVDAAKAAEIEDASRLARTALLEQTDAERAQREQERIQRLGPPPRSKAYQDASLYTGLRPTEVQRRNDADTHAKTD